MGGNSHSRHKGANRQFVAKNGPETNEFELDIMDPFLGSQNKIQIQQSAGNSNSNSVIKSKGGNCEIRRPIVICLVLLVLFLVAGVFIFVWNFKCEASLEFLQWGSCNATTTVLPTMIPPAPTEYKFHPKEYLLPKLSYCEDELTSQLVTEYGQNSQNFKKSRNKRVTGGRVADKVNFPWMVQIKASSGNGADAELTCGGSLINYRYVLTSAHCVTPPEGYVHHVVSVVLRNGEDIEIENTTVHFNYTRQVKEIQDHFDLYSNDDHSDKISTVENKGPYFNHSYRPFDIALIRLKQPVDLNIQRPICLPYKHIYEIQNSAGFDKNEAQHFSAGWGYLCPNCTEPSEELNYLHLPIMNNTFCQNFFVNDTKIHTRMTCAGGVMGQDLCQGDSGGPLFVSVGGRSFQVGVASFGHAPCAASLDTGSAIYSSPSVFLNVTTYLPWILGSMWP